MNNPNYSAFFTSLSTSEIIEESCTDFVAQLAGFMASLIVDAPSEAYWITELANYDFRGAAAYLVASVPGIHAHVSPSFSPDYKLSVSFLSKKMELYYNMYCFLSFQLYYKKLKHHSNAGKDGDYVLKIFKFQAPGLC